METSAKIVRTSGFNAANLVGKLFQLLDFTAIADALATKRGKYLANTPAVVQATLERAFATNAKIRVYYGNPATGRSWMDTENVVGRVDFGEDGTPLLVADDKTQTAIRSDKIIRVIQFDTKFGFEMATLLYQAANFSLPDMLIVPVGQHDYFKYEVLTDGYGFERFDSLAKAESWIAFMEGVSSTL